MIHFLPDLSSLSLLFACAVALVAGVVKGVVGFAMPMIMISGLSSMLAPELALAGLILPTLVTNGMQALRQGPQAALHSVRRFRWFLIVGLVMLLLSSQLVAVLPGPILLIVIGAPLLVFAAMQLAGWTPRLARASLRLELGIGAVAGFIGGLSGVWGPPVVAYLTALDTEKREQIRVQGVIYGLGAVALTGAHLVSGVFDRQGAILSALLVPVAVAGMWLGGLLQDRIDQAAFQRATLVVLLIAAANLLRRGLVGG